MNRNADFFPPRVPSDLAPLDPYCPSLGRTLREVGISSEIVRSFSMYISEYHRSCREFLKLLVIVLQSRERKRNPSIQWRRTQRIERRSAGKLDRIG